MSYNVIDIAHKLLCKAKAMDNGDLMSNLKLQKMLYYEQGYHLAAFSTPLFDEEVVAWMYGPVVECVYNTFRDYKRNGIEPQDKEPIKLTNDEEELFEEVFQAYADFSAYGLMRKTHEEMPWKTTEPKQIISKDKMRTFFSTLMQNGEEN